MTTAPDSKVQVYVRLLNQDGELWRPVTATKAGDAFVLRAPCQKASAGRTSPAPWSAAALLKKVFAVDVLACPSCGGRLQLIAFIAEALVGLGPRRPGTGRHPLPGVYGARQRIPRLVP